MVMHALSHRTQEAEAEAETEAEGSLCELQDSQYYTERPWLKNIEQ